MADRVTITLRPYQQQMVSDVQAAWAGGAQNVLLRADTGAGKTATLAYIHHAHQGASCIVAHRQELVGQLSLTLARYGLRHNIIAADNTRKAIARAHVEEFGQCYYTPGARAAIASVDTLIRADGLESWAAQVTLWTNDEAHHLVRDNKWCKAVSLFTHPACRGLMPTATPRRADGKGLGRHADGYADAMVSGPPMRWLIDHGYLTDYEIVCPPSDLLMLDETGAAVDPGASGDWSPQQLRKAAQRSHIIGDVVREYKRWANGRLGVTFCTDVETAIETTEAYRANGVLAETLTGKTLDHLRRDILRRYARREIHQLVTVDIVSEGFDLPAIEVASMARPTQSLALYMQQFGRALRPLEGKAKALIIDHASNTVRMGGPPDKPRVWSLDRRDRKASSAGGIPLRVCIECFHPYERIHRACPYCGHEPEPASRSSPAAVDGDLEMLDAATLARLRGEVERVDLNEYEYAQMLIGKFAKPAWVSGGVNRHREQQAAQTILRETMARWGGVRRAAGHSDSQMQREFYFTFGLSVIEAMALCTSEAAGLTVRIDDAVKGG